MISGGMAGIALWTVIFPADVIKSRQQVELSAKFNVLFSFFWFQVSGISEPMFRAGFTILKTEGGLALYNGLLPTLLRTFPATGALFCAVEYSKKFMYNMNS